MTKFVRDTKAGKAISAYVILNPKGEHVATAQAHYSEAGVMTLNVFHTDGTTPVQTATTRGHGINKLAHALAEIDVDGYRLDRGQGFSFLNELGYTVIQAI